jgi:Zn-finger nucleic acid-binding protein
MDGRSKFDKYTQLWRDVERAREDIYFAQKDRELIAALREKGQQELEQAILELCAMRCPKCGRKLQETVYQRVRIDRCSGCGGVWLDPGELETLAPEEHGSWLDALLHRLTGKGAESQARQADVGEHERQAEGPTRKE